MKKIIFTMLLLWSAVSANVLADGGVQLRGITIDNVSLGGRMMRFTNNGGLFIDDAGICLEGDVSLRVTGHNGKRLFCILAPLDAEGYMLEDNLGPALNITAFKVNNAQGNKVRVRIPYAWLDMENTRANVSFYVSIVDADLKDIGKGTVNLSQDKIKIDPNTMPERMLGQVLSGNDSFGLGDLFMGMLGANTASIKNKCISCDGYGLCPYCDGEGFFKPSVCSRCSTDPGICRRCKGAREETTRFSY